MAFNNEIRLQGNLTKDPEYKNISESDLVTFRLTVNDSIGKGKEETIFHVEPYPLLFIVGFSWLLYHAKK